MLTNIPSTLYTAVADWQDTTLKPKNQGGIAETCIVYYAPTPSAILTPELTPVGGKVLDLSPTALDFPAEFNQEDPMEFSQNYIDVEQTETIYMTIEWTPAKFNPKLYPGYKYQDGMIMSKGFVSDLQKVRNAEYIEIFQSAGHNHYRFKLVGEPVIPGQFTGARYFYAWWMRA
jgi:hypothetical protein